MAHGESQVLDIYYYICSPSTAVFTYLSKTILCADSVHFFTLESFSLYYFHSGIYLEPHCSYSYS